MNNKLIVICGPTGTGKTSLATKLSQKFGGEIISADSRQIYTGMDIGTGKKKITADSSRSCLCQLRELSSPPTHLQSFRNPDQPLNAWEFASLAREKIKELHQKGNLPFLVGGTGLYIDTTLGNTTLSQVPPNPQLRKELEILSTEELFERLKELDPERAKNIDKNNPRRLIRAIEVAVDDRSRICPGQIRDLSLTSLKLGLTGPRELLYKRADEWVDTIVKEGLLEEIQQLRNRGYGETEALHGLIYKEGGDFLDGKITQPEMIQQIKFSLHHYIRRQLTWFRRDKDIHWLDISQPDIDDKAVSLVSSFIEWTKT